MHSYETLFFQALKKEAKKLKLLEFIYFFVVICIARNIQKMKKITLPDFRRKISEKKNLIKKQILFELLYIKMLWILCFEKKWK